MCAVFLFVFMSSLLWFVELILTSDISYWEVLHASPRRGQNVFCLQFIWREGDGDVVGVVTPLVRGGAQVLHGDQVVELSVLLEVHEREEKGEDGEGQIEVESERGELKERRTCTWMT